MTLLHVILRKIEDVLGVSSRYIYTRLDVGQRTYSAWRTGKNKNPREVRIYEQYKKIFGIDLYLSMERDEIVVCDPSKLSEEAYKILVTDGPVRIADEMKVDE